jgi:hypothetical protein
MAMLQSAMFALLLEHDPEAWYLHSMVEFGCCLYAVSSDFSFPCNPFSSLN